MNLNILKDFAMQYSLPTVIIAIITSVLAFLSGIMLKNKAPKLVINILPFLIAIVLYLGYDMIFTFKTFTIKTESVYGGLICGSLGIIIVSAIKKIVSGKPLPLSATALLVESLLAEFVDEKNLLETAKAIDDLVNNANENESQLRDKVANKISEVSPHLTQTELRFASTIIIEAVKMLRSKIKK